MGRSLVHMDDSGEDILLSNTLRNDTTSSMALRIKSLFGRLSEENQDGKGL